MYIFLENNNMKNGKKKRRKKRVEKDSNPAPSARPNHYTTEAAYATLGKVFNLMPFPSGETASKIIVPH